MPAELIAQEPLAERDASRLLWLDLRDGRRSHHRFHDLPVLLERGDLLVVNDSRVFPARLQGGRAELLLLARESGARWQALVRPARRWPLGARLSFGGGRLVAHVVEVLAGGRRIVELEHREALDALLEEIGRTPLPPYIKRSDAQRESADRVRYQTVYARDPGSVAAPTAGLHFTESLLEALSERSIEVARLTHHVGYGTFQPIRTERVEEHRIAAERYFIPPETARAIADTRGRGGRVVAVGTTTVRALESAARGKGEVAPGQGVTELFIYPGFEFKIIQGLVTNFHLPASSLLLLVCAFGGLDRVRAAYEEAIRWRYRFYSYGDAMLFYPR